MAPKSKSLFRQPGARHFQVVHRSQRDPLIHDPDASQHVLKEISRQKGKGRAELEASLSEADIDFDAQNRVGEAALYGIYFDDMEYDYMQHLRPAGVEEDGVESILIEAPSKKKAQPVGNAKSGISFRELQDVLPSASELPRTYESQQNIPHSISGFQPDMDPHLRQTLEALEDDAFVDDELEDDFFGELIQDGARGSDSEVDYDFYEHEPAYGSDQNTDSAEELGTWEERFAQFKAAQKAHTFASTSDDEDNFLSEGGDTVPGLPSFSVVGGKRRRKGSSDASGYSMSSSSMYRNEALQTLDERFDQVMLKQYGSGDDDEPSSNGDENEAPPLITSREDFTSMMDEFLNDYEILGRKMKPKLDGDTGVDKLNTFRKAMGQDDRVRETFVREDDDEDDNDNEFLRINSEERKDKWDCETILTTYSNLENHPRLIRVRDSKPVSKIKLDPKTGLPSVAQPTPSSNQTRFPIIANDSDESDESSDATSRQLRRTISRPRGEDLESKKARKTAVKAQQADRRADKKAMKEAFGREMKKVKAIQKIPVGVKKL
ncbi:hypothetical protein D9757_002263 [Collybiopsis confluens]|uniref:Low temperature viability protein n=1 Tax=Collybiopsis confluens TaxID=2823264 RepID=A0A8H5I0C5_9AGAR|nr:hypothetical protein D9757_002263 [Collybiopsis confluens]